ncbi:MAG: copper amine oxidase N-terminal domain-containing protein [Caldisericia bacterium]
MINIREENPEIIETKLAANKITIADGAIYTTVGTDLYCYRTYKDKPAPPPSNGGKDEDDIVVEEPTKISIRYQLGSDTYFVDESAQKMDVVPQVIGGRTLLPARYVTEPLGGSVSWDGTERKVICTLGDKTIELWIGKPTARIDGVETQIDPDNPDVVPTIIDGRTMVPMRFLAESLGCEVEWIADTKEIVLRYSE